VFIRQKNLTASRAKSNCVKDAKTQRLLPFSLQVLLQARAPAAALPADSHPKPSLPARSRPHPCFDSRCMSTPDPTLATSSFTLVLLCRGLRQSKRTTSTSKPHPVRIGPLQEVTLVRDGLVKYGPKSWAEIATHVLPHRDASTMARLYREAGGGRANAAGLGDCPIYDGVISHHAQATPIRDFLLTGAAATAPHVITPAQVSFLDDAYISLGDAKSSLGDAESSLGDAESSLGDADSSLGDA
jgi:hypothetical protein